ncbi:MAG: DUF5689 domain-containing protein [Porphyromonas sp.]|nr:DUF5689 domain-containing protein [Porphyromonas sp.]
MFAKMHTKSLTLLAGLSLLATTFVGCKDNDDSYSRPSIELSEQLASVGLNLTAEGTSQQITFTANRKWTASGPAWLDITPSSGEAGTHTISVKALENAGLERKGQILVKYGSGSQTINVVQAGTGTVSTSYAGMPLSEFIAKYGAGEGGAVSDDVTFQAVVISDKDGANLNALKNIYVQAEGAGIAVRLAASNTYPAGTLLTFKAQGATVSRYNGSMQINLEKGGSVEDAGELREIQPTVATLEDVYAGKYENMLVAIEGLQFVKAEGNLYTGTYTTAYSTLTDCSTKPTDTQPLSLAVTKFAAFKDTPKSNKRGRITGILTHSVSTSGIKNRNISPRTLADLQLDQEPCTETTTPPSTGGGENPGTPGGGSNPGGNTGGDNPGTTPAPAGAHPIITAYVEGKSFDKYIQIYNPTDAAIDLTGYSLRLQPYSGKNVESQIQTLALTGTLAPKTVMVFKHKDASKFDGVATVSSEVCNFNGNDNVAIFKGEDIIDILGTWGAAWVTAEKASGLGVDVVFKRNAAVTAPKATFDMTEWGVTPIADFADYNFLSKRP